MEHNKHNAGKYFTTGEFARLCGVKKQTLFHYDDIGILKPEKKGTNGYRYYSYLQLDTFFNIDMLKGLGMPLAEIKKYLNSRSPESFLDLLHEQSLLIDEKISELNWMREFINERTRITQEGLSASHGIVYTEERPEEYYLMTAYNGTSSDRDIYKAIRELLNYCHKNGVYSPHSIGGLVDTCSYMDATDYNYSHLFTRLTPFDIKELDPESITVADPCRYAVICNTSGYDDNPVMFRKLLDFAAENNLDTGRFFYEDTLLDEMTRFYYDDYTVKISIPVFEKP